MRKKHMPKTNAKTAEGYDRLEMTLNLLQVVVSAFLLGYTIGKDMAKKEEKR